MPRGQTRDAPVVFVFLTLLPEATALGDPGLEGDVFGAFAR
jgi:hypothetical protein